ncbi:MAG: ATPase, T2SS/T4P/T4SS family [Candidatus Diapherotrites archaeon]
METVRRGQVSFAGEPGHNPQQSCGAGSVEEILGWGISRIGEGAGRVLRQGGRHAIIRCRGGERVYCIEGFPNLTRGEALAIRGIMERFRERQELEQHKFNASAIEKALNEYCAKELLELDSDQREYLLSVLHRMVFGFGVLSELLDDDAIEEIAVIGLGKEKPVHVYERSFGWLRTNIYFSSETVVRNLVNRMGMQIGRRLAMQTPRMNAVLPDGSRLNACIEPVAFSGPCVTIRKFRKKPFTPAELAANRTISAEALAFLWMAMQTDVSVVICGNTGSGKTTTMNALFSFIPAAERIIVTEETPEISLPHAHVVKLNTAENLGIGMDALITDSLRMRPDRVIVGEVRNGEELGAFVNTILAGQGKGSYATFHAQSAAECIARMRKLGVMEIDLSAIDLIVVQKRWNRVSARGNSEVRKVVEIAEVSGSAGNGKLAGESGDTGKAKLNTLFAFDYAKDALVRKNPSEKVMEKMLRTYPAGRAGIEKEMRGREFLIRSLAGKEIGMGEFFTRINKGGGAE